MSSIFTKIINKELPGSFLWRDEQCVVFLSINPVRQGHSLVVPIREVDHWLDLETQEIQHLTQVGQYIGIALEEIYKPERIGIMIAGFEVPHTHLHIMCIDNMDDMDIVNTAFSVTPEDLQKTAGKIREVLKANGHTSISET